MIIAIDFDGTIVEHAYPKIGKPIPFAIETLKELQRNGHTLLMWTVREGTLLQEAIDYVEGKGVKFYAYNKNYPEEDDTKASRKLNADIFVDDRNVCGFPDWGTIYRAIQAAEKGAVKFADVLHAMERENRMPGRKKNFFIRLGEMFDNDGY